VLVEMLREHDRQLLPVRYPKATIGEQLLGAAGLPKPASGSYIDS
jgi:hypothetical protein